MATIRGNELSGPWPGRQEANSDRSIGRCHSYTVGSGMNTDADAGCLIWPLYMFVFVCVEEVHWPATILEENARPTWQYSASGSIMSLGYCIDTVSHLHHISKLVSSEFTSFQPPHWIGFGKLPHTCQCICPSVSFKELVSHSDRSSHPGWIPWLRWRDS